MKNSNWTEIIYDVYDYLYWEPQHIWKIKNKNSKIKNQNLALEHVKQLEVSLNQILNIFFYFLPYSIFKKLLEVIIDKNIDEDNYSLYFNDISEIIDWVNKSTQPDFFFIWSKINIAIEIKTNSKSSLDQIMKYSFLHLKEIEKSWLNKKFVLIFIWKWDFQNLWKEKFSNILELKESFESYKIQDFTKKWNTSLMEYKYKIKELVKNSEINFISYKWLQEFCKNEIDNNKDNEMLVKLLNWVIKEIDCRQF